MPKELDWNLWLGTAEYKDYMDNLVPFNWRGWWDYGTGALGDMACHIMEPAFSVLGLDYPTAAECSVSTRYIANWNKAYYPESGPVSSHIILTFEAHNQHKKNKTHQIKLHWMDGGIQPERPPELLPNETNGRWWQRNNFYRYKRKYDGRNLWKKPATIAKLLKPQPL